VQRKFLVPGAVEYTDASPRDEVAVPGSFVPMVALKPWASAT